MRVMMIVKETGDTENCVPPTPNAMAAMHKFNASAIDANRYPSPARRLATARSRYGL
jgi:hypothetical protein